LAPVIQGTSPSTVSPNSVIHYEIRSANGKSFSLPVTDCPAVSCTNGDPIAWYGGTAQDQATLAAYKEALDKQTKKDAVTGVLMVGTVATLPATLTGAVVGGAIVGGGSSLAGQAIDKGKVDDPNQVFVATGKGAVLGGGASTRRGYKSFRWCAIRRVLQQGQGWQHYCVRSPRTSLNMTHFLDGDPIRYSGLSPQYRVLRHGPFGVAASRVIGGAEVMSFQPGRVMEDMTSLIHGGNTFDAPVGVEIGRWDKRFTITEDRDYQDLERLICAQYPQVDQMYYAWVDSELWDYDPHVTIYTKAEFMGLFEDCCRNYVTSHPERREEFAAALVANGMSL
jgi:hypothetical protein